MVFVAVVGPCLVARGPSAAFPEEVGAEEASPVGALRVEEAAAEAFLVEVLPSAAEEEAAAPLPCRVAGRTSRVLLRGRAPSLMLGASRARLVPSRARRPFAASAAARGRRGG